MARITVEDCLKEVNNRFALIHMAAKRVRQLRRGAEPMVVSKNRDVVVALREIAAGEVVEADIEEQDRLTENAVEMLSQSQEGKTEEEAPAEGKEEEPAV